MNNLVGSATLNFKTPRVFVPTLNRDVRYVGARGGRGSGKSHHFAEMMVEETAFAPKRAVCIREVQKSLATSSKQLLEDKIGTYKMGAYFDVQRERINTAIGGHIIFQGMQDHTADSIKSLEGYDIFWIEEARGLSQRSLDILRPTIRKKGAQLWATWNPEDPKDPIDILFRGDDPRNLPGGGLCVEANYEDNPFFPDDLRAEMEYDRARDPEKFQHVWRGGYLVMSEKRVFKNWKVAEFDTPTGCTFRFGGDFGFAVDPSVLIRCWIGRWEDTGVIDAQGRPMMRAVADDKGRTLFIDYEAYRVGCDVDHTAALFAGDCPHGPGDARAWKNPYGDRGIPGAIEWQIIADSARPETISYLARQGFRIKGARKGPGSVEEGVNFLKMYDIVIHPRCVHARDEFTYYSFKTDPKTGLVLPVLQDKKNHVIDAARYAVEDVRKGGGFFSMPH